MTSRTEISKFVESVDRKCCQRNEEEEHKWQTLRERVVGESVAFGALAASQRLVDEESESAASRTHAKGARGGRHEELLRMRVNRALSSNPLVFRDFWRQNEKKGFSRSEVLPAFCLRQIETFGPRGRAEGAEDLSEREVRDGEKE
jgi:hypothetical protein